MNSGAAHRGSAPTPDRFDRGRGLAFYCVPVSRLDGGYVEELAPHTDRLGSRRYERSSVVRVDSSHRYRRNVREGATKIAEILRPQRGGRKNLHHSGAKDMCTIDLRRRHRTNNRRDIPLPTNLEDVIRKVGSENELGARCYRGAGRIAAQHRAGSHRYPVAQRPPERSDSFKCARTV